MIDPADHSTEKMESQANTPSPEVTAGPAVQAQVPVASIIEAISNLNSSVGTPATQEQTQEMANDQFDADVIVIGAGPGGYYAAIRAAQHGAKVTSLTHPRRSLDDLFRELVTGSRDA
jgi:dihydrolipoamide dehydrogenase